MDKESKIYVNLMLIFTGICLFILPIFDIPLWGRMTFGFVHGIILLGCINVLFVWIILTKEFLQKGNITTYNLEKFHLVWKDEWQPKKTALEKRKREKLLLTIYGAIIAILIPLLIYTFTVLWNRPSTVLGVLFMIMGPLVCISLFVAMVGHLLTRNFQSPQLEVYKEGIRYINNFFEWKDIQFVYFPEVHEVTRGFRRYGLRFHTLKLTTINRDTYMIQVMHRQKFLDAMKESGKVDLISKS